MIRKSMPSIARTRPQVDMRWVEGTRIFHKHAAIREEILRHKWIESEKAGYDIGWERASQDWMIYHSKNTGLR